MSGLASAMAMRLEQIDRVFCASSLSQGRGDPLFLRGKMRGKGTQSVAGNVIVIFWNCSLNIDLP